MDREREEREKRERGREGGRERERKELAKRARERGRDRERKELVAVATEQLLALSRASANPQTCSRALVTHSRAATQQLKALVRRY